MVRKTVRNYSKMTNPTITQPRWKRGSPNAQGLWIVDLNGDFYVWVVERDRDEKDNCKFGPEYLRFSDTDTSEPIKGCLWPPKRSYGPCPLPDGTIDIKSANVAIYEEGV